MQSKNHTPKVSILLPNLNTSKYLPARFESIQAQTFTDWETIVVDSYSNDGAWELIQQYAQNDPRILISQAPREGIYAGLNRCINLAKGEYIYIATSDDTMMPNFLEEMVAALDTYTQCSLAHCCLTFIDEFGKPIKPNPWDEYYSSLYYGEMLKKFHIRQAPLDGILHCFLLTAYTSLTQLLIRRSLFEKVGNFSTRYGSMADFGWGMKASLVCDTIHIPKYLATWRRHPEQATLDADSMSPSYYYSLIEMIHEAVSLGISANPGIERYFSRMNEMSYVYNHLAFDLQIRGAKNRLEKIPLILKIIPAQLDIFLDRYVLRKALPDRLKYARKIIAKFNLSRRLIQLS
jgi:glycosyltransferase involved in cell wall biosynthesis